jgi:outer membrane lipoprotein LolB
VIIGMRWLVLLLIGLAGCTPTTGLKKVDTMAALHVSRPVMQFRLNGRISVRTPNQSYSGTLSWTRKAGEDTLLLSGPLGQGAAEIHRRNGQVRLKTADGSQIDEGSDEQLMERMLGVRLPLDGMVYWFSGLPRPGAEFQAGVDPQGRIGSLDQDGWHLEYSNFRRYGDSWRPGRIVAKQGASLEFRFVLDGWEAL